MILLPLDHTCAPHLHLVSFWGDREEQHRGGRMETDSSSVLPLTCCPASTHTWWARIQLFRQVLGITLWLDKDDFCCSIMLSFYRRINWVIVDLYHSWSLTLSDPAPSRLLLPFLWRRHQSGQFVVVEPPQGEVVERKVCTEREADNNMMMHEHDSVHLD